MDIETWMEIYTMILVTGATGYLGKKIVKRLGYKDVIGLSRRGKSEGIEHINCNLIDISVDMVPGRISTIIHSAAEIYNRSPDVFLTNVDGTKKLIEFAQKKKIDHFIFISTASVLLEKKNRYALSKLKAEELLVSSGLNYTIIRPNLIYGSENKQFMSLAAFLKKWKLVPVPGNGSFKVAPVYDEDLIGAIIACVENEKTYGKKYVICGKSMTFNDYLLAIASSQGLSRKLFHINEKLIFLVTYLYDKEFMYSFQDYYSDNSSAVEDLYFRPNSLDEGLKKVF